MISLLKVQISGTKNILLKYENASSFFFFAFQKKKKKEKFNLIENAIIIIL